MTATVKQITLIGKRMQTLHAALLHLPAFKSSGVYQFLTRDLQAQMAALFLSARPPQKDEAEQFKSPLRPDWSEAIPQANAVGREINTSALTLNPAGVTQSNQHRSTAVSRSAAGPNHQLQDRALWEEQPPYFTAQHTPDSLPEAYLRNRMSQDRLKAPPKAASNWITGESEPDSSAIEHDLAPHETPSQDDELHPGLKAPSASGDSDKIGRSPNQKNMVNPTPPSLNLSDPARSTRLTSSANLRSLLKASISPPATSEHQNSFTKKDSQPSFNWPAEGGSDPGYSRDHDTLAPQASRGKQRLDPFLPANAVPGRRSKTDSYDAVDKNYSAIAGQSLKVNNPAHPIDHLNMAPELIDTILNELIERLELAMLRTYGSSGANYYDR